MTTYSSFRPQTQNLVITGDTTLGDASGDTITVNGSTLNLAASAARIRGDFSNATVANRVAFQNSTTNNGSNLNLLPNGTAAGAFWNAFGNSDPTNAPYGQFGITGGNEVRIASSITGTGTYAPMTFFTGGSERARIDTSGNVGIGTSSPNGSLTISKQTTVLSGTGNTYGLHLYPTSSGAIYIDSLTNSSSNTSLYIRTYNNNVYNEMITNVGGNYTYFQTAATERMRITSGGAVGIATNSPTSALELYRVTSTTGSLTDASLMLSTSATTGRKVSIGFGLGGGVANTCAANIGYDVISGTGAGYGDIYFSTRSTTADSVPSERMRVTNAGAVLIGLSSLPANSNANQTNRIIPGGSSGGGFGAMHSASAGATTYFQVLNNFAYRVTIFSTSSSIAAAIGVYIFVGLNKAAGYNPTVLTLGTTGSPGWSFGYSLSGGSDTLVAVNAGSENQGTRAVVEQLGNY
jgi:hypothetical protein